MSGQFENEIISCLYSHDVDGKQVDSSGMAMVTVKCIDHSWTIRSESDWK